MSPADGRAAAAPPVAILCGGRGARLQERTQEIPKPLVEIGGMPIVWHVIRLYAAQGLTRFLLLTGYRGEQIERFVAGQAWPDGVTVQCLDTGPDTGTGARLALAEPVLAAAGGACFCATYADGVADIDLRELMRFHADHGRLATMTVVRPELGFGVTELAGDGTVTGFREKPRSEHWINGGFFCFQAGVFEYLRAAGAPADAGARSAAGAESGALERAPLQRLAADGQLRGYRHEGFWECMDTYKDAVALGDLWDAGEAPWRVWDDDAPAAAAAAGGGALPAAGITA